MMSIEILKAFLLGFTVGLTGTLVPGPMLFATIEASIKKGWTAGPEVILGHMMAELIICVFILLGVASLLGDSTISWISIVGGLSLVVFGLFTLKGARNVASSARGFKNSAGLKLKYSPVLMGIVTSVSNPYFWVWWLTAGSSLLLREYELGILVLVAYVLGHWVADISWFTAVSGSFSRGKNLFSGHAHEMILYVCGGLLVIFGLYFTFNYDNPVQLL